MSQQINLYNPLFLKQEKHFSVRTMLQGLALVVVGLLVLTVFAVVETQSVERLGRQYAEQVAAQREQFVAISRRAPQARSQTLEAEVARLEGDLRARRELIEALGSGELGNVAGFSDFMAAFGRQAMPGLWLTGFTVADAGNQLQLRGRAVRPELVPAYLQKLSDEPVMRGRRVSEMKLAAKPGQQKYVEFSIAAGARGGWR
jgi:hypothetical protein